VTACDTVMARLRFRVALAGDAAARASDRSKRLGDRQHAFRLVSPGSV
jgi:hypothetical protein